MKKKILAMLCASLLISFSAVACDSSETPECSTHVDADNNGYCDNCNTGVIKLVETTPATPEEYKEMVVNAIPDGGKITDYLKFEAEESATTLPASASLNLIEGYSNLNANSYQVNKLRQESEDNYGYYFDTYDVYNTKTGAKIYSFTTEEYNLSYEKDVVSINTNNPYYFRVVEKLYNGYSHDAETILRDYTGKIIARAEGEVEVTNTSTRAGYYYFTFDGKQYAFDTEEKTLVVNGVSPDFFVKRPNFSSVIGDNGYIVNNNSVYVYDISEWLETTFVYTVPSYLEDAQINVLSNGKILVQGVKILPDSAVNYDVIYNGAKCDVVQLIIDPANGEEKAVEFGYIIAEFANNNMDLSVDETANVAVVYPIENKAVNSNKELYVVLDNDLKILYCYEPALLGQEYELPEMLSVDRFLVTVGYGDGTSTKAIVDAEGKLVTYVPTGAEFEYGYIKLGSKIYDYDLNLKADLSDYVIERTFNNGSMILNKITVEGEGSEQIIIEEYFFFNAKTLSLTLLDVEGIYAYDNSYSSYFVVRVATLDEVTDLDVYSYKVFNADCKLVATFDAPVSNLQVVGDGIFKITSDGKDYLIK